MYRQFPLGMIAMAATAQIGVPETAAKIIHARPLLIQAPVGLSSESPEKSR